MVYSTSKGPRYEDIRALILQKQVYTPLLEDIKKHFVNDIASPRRYGSVKTLADLIECLENLDVISEYNVERLSIIDDFLEDDEITTTLASYIEPSLEDGLNVYQQQRTRERNDKLEIPCDFNKINIPKPVPSVSQSLSAPQFSENKRKAVYEVVANEIGRNWRNLGRELGVKNGHLDMIEENHRIDLQSRVFGIFELFEKDASCERKMHFFKICEALDKCKRKDLRRTVQNIMMNDDFI